jgi:hypothetical protein
MNMIILITVITKAAAQQPKKFRSQININETGQKRNVSCIARGDRLRLGKGFEAFKRPRPKNERRRGR